MAFSHTSVARVAVPGFALINVSIEPRAKQGCAGHGQGPFPWSLTKRRRRSEPNVKERAKWTRYVSW